MGKLLIKGYQIGAQIDQSGLKTLYRGVHLASRKEVFLTVIQVRPGRAQDQLLKRAAQSKKLLLPELMTAMECGVLQEDSVWFSHPALPSVPLVQVLRSIRDEEKRLLAMVGYLVQALEILDYIHTARTTHRDLQTAQLRVDGQDRVLLEGFVNARPKIEGRNILNMVHLPYMAPEQMRGAPADRRTDLYSIGVILYELATGALPYESNFAKLEDARQGAVPSPSRVNSDIPLELENIIMKALGPRSSRYRYAQEMIKDLKGFQRGLVVGKRLHYFMDLLKSWVPGGHLVGTERR